MNSENQWRKNFVSTSLGEIAYLETGDAKRPPVLFVHGIPTSSYLWRRVIGLLQNDFHCLAPDLIGLGDTKPAPGAPLHMDSQAEMLAEFMQTLGHKTYGLVCHDQGGAAAQILATRFSDRIRAWAITDSVAYDNWPVPVIARLQRGSRIPFFPEWLASLGCFQWIETSTPFGSFKRGVYNRTCFTNEAIREYLRPLIESEESRRRFFAFLRAGSERYTLQVVPALKEFDKPTTVIWAADDRYISPSWGYQLYQDIPGAQTFDLVPFCGHFWQEEKPAEFTAKIGAFLARHMKAGAKPKGSQTKAAAS